MIQYAVVAYHQAKLVCHNCGINNKFEKREWKMIINVFPHFYAFFLYFLQACIRLAFKSTESQNCPCCRQNLSKVELQPNENLKTALRAILTGYDAGKK